MVKVILLAWVAFNGLARDWHIVRAIDNTLHERKEQSIVLGKEKIKMVRNTNALCGPERVSRIGVFERKATAGDLVDYRLVDQVAARSAGRDKTGFSFAERETRYFINGVDMTRRKGERNLASALVARTCDLEAWSGVNAVESAMVGDGDAVFLRSTILSGGKPQTSLVPLRLSGCRRVGRLDGEKGEVFDCPVPRYGFARLILDGKPPSL